MLLMDSFLTSKRGQPFFICDALGEQPISLQDSVLEVLVCLSVLLTQASFLGSWISCKVRFSKCLYAQLSKQPFFAP